MKKLLIIFLLSSCSQKRDLELPKFEQVPPELYLMPKTHIVTQYGEYVSGSEVEVWHSHKKYINLQDEISKFRPLSSGK
jgi:hypothetical protein